MADGTMGGALDQNVFKVSIGYLSQGQHCQTGFKLRDVAVNDNDAGEVNDAVQLWANGAFKALLLDSDFLEYVDVVKLFSEEGSRHDYVNNAGTRAASASSILPTFLACNISLKTQRRKRYGQGRMFWPMRDDRWVDLDILNAGGIAAFQGAIDDLVARFTGLTADLHLCNSHLTIPARAATTTTPARAAIPPHWYDVDTVKLETAVTAIKSRKVGRGS
jgi:hypothetical protein